MTSRKCQNMLRRINRDRTGWVSPFLKTCPIATAIQSRPKETGF